MERDRKRRLDRLDSDYPGHASIATTSLYVHSDNKRWARSMVNFGQTRPARHDSTRGAPPHRSRRCSACTLIRAVQGCILQTR